MSASPRSAAWARAALAAVLAVAAACTHGTGAPPAAPRPAPPAARAPGPASRPAPGPRPAASAPAPAPAPASAPASQPLPVAASQPRYRAFATPAEALAEILRTRPQIIAFGEYHQQAGAARVPSALKRFTQQMLATLAGLASDVIVETWAPEGSCGEVEREVVKDVKKTTKRPKATEDEVGTLFVALRTYAIQPHFLKVSCDEYRLLLGGARVDYDQLLRLLTRKLVVAAMTARTERDRKLAAAAAEGRLRPGTRRLVAIYGGALHNDLFPSAGTEAWTFGAYLWRATRGRYVEVDLYVPEWVRADTSLASEPWYPLLRHAGPRTTLLITRGPGSFIVIFPTTRRR
ncbi:MAG TPA: hypothetical protein VGQ83_26585 [Polyangia bacterium]